MSKSFIRILVNSARRERLDYNTFIRCCKTARQILKLTRPSRSRHLPQLLPESSLRRFYRVIDEGANLQHQLLLRLLFYTAIRVSELVHIAIADVDIAACKIFISRGKGDKDRYVLFPEQFKLALQSHMLANPHNKYLFESRRKDKFTTRQIQRIVQDYAATAELPERVHPHLLRHQLLTWLTSQGMTDAQIQLISGHASKVSLEVYQHLGLKDVTEDYQSAVRKLPQGI